MKGVEPVDEQGRRWREGEARMILCCNLSSFIHRTTMVSSTACRSFDLTSRRLIFPSRHHLNGSTFVSQAFFSSCPMSRKADGLHSTIPIWTHSSSQHFFVCVIILLYPFFQLLALCRWLSPTAISNST